jgi:hypothetical protein
MVYSHSRTTRRPRSSLRKGNTFEDSGNTTIFSTGTDDAIYDRNKVLSSGFTVGEAWGCLDKTWVGFRTAKRLENYSDMKLYASVIQRLEKELKIEVNVSQTLDFVLAILKKIQK